MRLWLNYRFLWLIFVSKQFKILWKKRFATFFALSVDWRLCACLVIDVFSSDMRLPFRSCHSTFLSWLSRGLNDGCVAGKVLETGRLPLVCSLYLGVLIKIVLHKTHVKTQEIRVPMCLEYFWEELCLLPYTTHISYRQTCQSFHCFYPMSISSFYSCQ